MDRAKESVKKVLGRSGQHDTTIHESVAPAVQHETVNQTQREHVTQAVDREVHQDHYHTSEQPIHHSEVLPEQHHHRQAGVEERSFEHDNRDDVKRRLAEDTGKYRDHSERVQGESTTHAEPTVAGEHVHHHVYENIQPIVQKQTVEPHVMHTTVPVHEVHHNSSQHHSSSALPPVSMEEFKNKGGALGGREERRDKFSGEPRSFGPDHDHHNTGTLSSHNTGSQYDNDIGRSTHTTGSSHTPIASEMTSGHGTSGHSSGLTSGSTATPTSGTTSGKSFGHMEGSSTSSTTQKPGLMDKLNPKVDANGDGQPGFMK